MTKSNFFGRQNYLDILTKRSAGLLEGYRQNIAIIGDENIGKTTLLFEFLNSLYNNRIIPLYMEIRQEETIEHFARRFIGVLLYNFLLNSGIPLQEDLSFLVRKSQGYIPQATEKIHSLLAGLARKKTNNLFTALLSLCDTIYLETGKRCIVIFDEFQNLESLGFSNFYREWSKLLITQKNTMYIISSSQKFKTRLVLSKHLSLLFGNFELITLEPLDINTSLLYLEEKLHGVPADSDLRHFIVHFTGGNPLYLEVISDALCKHHQDGFATVLEKLLFDPSGILNQKFSNYLKRFLDLPRSQDYISVLYLIASGRNKIKDITHLLRRQQKAIISRINHLLEVDTVSRSGDFLKINDRVFGFWLKFVYQGKLQSLTFDAKNQKKKFRDYIEEMLVDFLRYAKRPVIERVSELLRLFENDVMHVEKKKIRLNHFREIKPLEFSGGHLQEGLIGRSQECVWIIAFKREQVNEDDIAEFSRECKKYRHKLQKKILVTLRELDSTTQLRAFEEKIWTWDRQNLNQLLDLYSKPWVLE